jgi:hypothetical protein
VSYWTRLQARRQKSKERASREREAVLLDAEQIMSAYSDAYFALYQECPDLSYAQGWYEVNGRNVRRSDLIKETGILQARLHETEITP